LWPKSETFAGLVREKDREKERKFKEGKEEKNKCLGWGDTTITDSTIIS
jgi:hypothetical protein